MQIIASIKHKTNIDIIYFVKQLKNVGTFEKINNLVFILLF